MNELDLVRALRAEQPPLSDTAIAGGRARLMRAARPRPRRARRVLRPTLAVAIAAAVAFAVVIGVTSTPARSPVPAGSLSLAEQVLASGAARLGAEPVRRPAPTQWIYSRAVQWAAGEHVQSDANWIRFDGRAQAYRLHGRLVVDGNPAAAPGPGGALARYVRSDSSPLVAYDALAALPRAPRAMLALVGGLVRRHPGAIHAPAASPADHATVAQLEFSFLASLLWDSAQAAPADAVAAVYHTLALVPGVTALRTRDALGRSAIALADRGDSQQLLLDPRTYRVTGVRTVSDGHWPVNAVARHSPTYARGTVVSSLGWARIALVARPGAR